MKNKVDFLKGYAKGLKLDEKTDDVSKLLSAIIDCIDSMADQIDDNTVEIDDMNDAIDDLQDSIDDLEEVIDELDDFDDFDDDDDFDFNDDDDDFDDDDDDDDDDIDDPDGCDLHIDVSSNMDKNDIAHNKNKVVKTKREINALAEELIKLVSSLSDNNKTE